MTQDERTNHETFLDFPETFDDADNGYEDDVLRGNRAADISHAGEGIEDPEEHQADEELLEMLEQQQKYVVSFCLYNLLLILYLKVSNSLDGREIIGSTQTALKSW
jgi:hypothetical protein